MNLTAHQAKYFAYELSKKVKSNSTEKFGATLMDAKVDLNPHQIQAALFAFKSPLSQGAILADEVGLGKTIEAGILLAQKWAEGSRRILIISPSSLRKQWMNELMDKFYLPSEVMETKIFNKRLKKGNKNPFENKDKIQICSYHFARNKAEYLQLVSWDLIVIDEAHFLRNVYRTGNKIAAEIQQAISPYKKVLLTATPLQNKIEELYGLVSFIDPNTFGDLKSFKKQFIRKEGGIDLDELKERIQPLCHRTLRRQVTEYINYKNRIPLTQTFEPSPKEQELYEKVTDYLQRETNYALPLAQKHLMTSVLRKLLASSSFAISGTLSSLIRRLKKLINDYNEDLEDFRREMEEQYEGFDEDVEEWDQNIEEIEATFDKENLTAADIENIKREIADLEGFLDLANSIQHNAKGDKLMIALRKGFEKLQELGANQKAIIFTESTRTQQYLYNMLQDSVYKDKILLFNGTNNEDISKKVYHNWVGNKKNAHRVTGSRDVDIRSAIVDTFKTEDYQLMIATEAAAEGINLQFCSMVVNYDLPWNPQRIEQRIGRCHRYGQEYDVVVINFLNTSNETDMRVFQLLEEKFSLFDGVFGASDEVLGSIESGVDFEKRLIQIYKQCRTKEEIDRAFDELQEEMREQIDERMKTTQEHLFKNFDAQVVQRLKTTLENTKKYISKYEDWLWKITKYSLQGKAEFNDRDHSFVLNGQSGNIAPKGLYSLDKKREEAWHYRLGHTLAEKIIESSKRLETPVGKISFDYSSNPLTYKELEDLKSKRGLLRVTNMKLNSPAENLDLIVFSGITENGEVLKDELCQFLLTLSSSFKTSGFQADYNKLEKNYQVQKQKHLDHIKNSDAQLLQTEIRKFEKWAEDRITSTELDLKDVKNKIKELERQTRTENISADDLLEIQKKIRKLDRKKAKLRREIFKVEDRILEERDQMIDEAENKLNRTMKEQELFTIAWEII
ncbi:DEAD/DEAH box helicase [Antarcticibacterium arcticum]|uniref:DEAD/DEAH box helicase n=1 Tax=Antarcticibacterium arcticum TaxID=2585771 RepID=A0A5B8YIP4_9FLAO|nr:SNF2-related protein [Antarcticibacterium arcticum]QED36707.1 DEAD/DEAH box helicase [Antarcticibacterium arcticum]